MTQEGINDLIENLGACMKVSAAERRVNGGCSVRHCCSEFADKSGYFRNGEWVSITGFWWTCERFRDRPAFFPQRAVEYGMDLAVNTRIDDGRALGGRLAIFCLGFVINNFFCVHLGGIDFGVLMSDAVF